MKYIVKHSFSDILSYFKLVAGSIWLCSRVVAAVLTSGTICLVVAGPASEHRDGPRDRGRLQHGQDIHCHGLRRARSQESYGDYAGQETSVSTW